MDVAAPVVLTQPKLSPADPLAAALLTRSVAAANLEGATVALARAQLDNAKAHARLARYGDLDARIARSRADMIKRDRSGPLPERLISELEQRTEAHEQVRESAGALEVLKVEHADAENALREAAQALSVEACKVMLAEAAALADEVGSAYRRISELSDRLRGLEVMMLGAFSTLPAAAVLQLRAQLWRVLEAAQPPKRPYVPAMALVQSRQAVAPWRERHSQLIGQALRD